MPSSLSARRLRIHLGIAGLVVMSLAAAACQTQTATQPAPAATSAPTPTARPVASPAAASPAQPAAPAAAGTEGTLSAADRSGITVKKADGSEVTFTVSGSRTSVSGSVSSRDDLKEGQEVTVTGPAGGEAARIVVK